MWSQTHQAPTQETHHDRSYAHLVHLASPAQRLRLGLHPPRLPPLRRVDHRPGADVEEHTITQTVLASEQPAAWKALESFAEYGSWHQDRVTWALTDLIATAPGRIWHGYQVSAVDDTKVHRSSPHVWGTCTFHEYTARCPNRAPTVAPTTGWSWAGRCQSR